MLCYNTKSCQTFHEEIFISVPRETSLADLAAANPSADEFTGSAA